MAADFERRFREQSVAVFHPGGVRKVWSALGIAYVRFSDEGSNPRSLDQQLLNVLTKARQESVFVPRQYVCADSAITATIACRRGYIVAKMLIERRVDTGATWFLLDDLGRMSRNTIESLRLGELTADTGVRMVGASDGFDSTGQQSKLMLTMMSSFNEAFIDQLKSKVRRGMDDAFRRGENIQPPGVGYRMVPVMDAAGSVVITHKGTVEKRAEIVPEVAEWIRRGAEMIAYEGKSPIDVARLFNKHMIGGKSNWSDNRIRTLFCRERLVGREVLHASRQTPDRESGKIKTEKLDPTTWLRRESPHLRILSDELADAVRKKLNLAAQSFGKKAKDRPTSIHRTELYPKVLIRPICGCCEHPMLLGRSAGKYQSFFCHNALHGMKGCTNRGYKSARIIDEAVLGALSATVFTEGFISGLTADVNARLAAAVKVPLGSTKKLQDEITSRERQIARLTARLDKVDDASGLDAIFERVRSMEMELAAKREELQREQQRNRRPTVTRVKETDVTAALAHLRDLLQSDVGVAAPALKALVGNVVIESRTVEGEVKPQMFARFTINALPAMALLSRRNAASGAGADDPSVTVWEFLNTDRWTMLGKAPCSRHDVVVLLHRTRT